MEYFRKMKGTIKSPPTVSLSEIIWSWIGAFVMLVVTVLINNIPYTRQYPEYWI